MLFQFNFFETLLILVGYLISFFGQLELEFAEDWYSFEADFLKPYVTYKFKQIQENLCEFDSKIIIVVKNNMSVVNQLLSDVPQDRQKDYESYLHTHLKWLMTSINKSRVQDINQVLIRKDKCIQKCYKRNLDNSSVGDAEIFDTVQQIRQCKQRCGEEQKAVRKYLDDINYYSSLKLSGCSKNCTGDQYSPEYNKCIWTCLNKLDRRYKRYWVEQREKIQSKFKLS